MTKQILLAKSKIALLRTATVLDNDDPDHEHTGHSSNFFVFLSLFTTGYCPLRSRCLTIELRWWAATEVVRKMRMRRGDEGIEGEEGRQMAVSQFQLFSFLS